MTAWKVIKEQLTKGSTPGSFGYMRNVQKAALLYGALSTYLKNDKHEDFNADDEARQALLSGTFIKLVEECL